MAKIKFSGKSHRREVLKQIVERYLHKRIEESRCEDSENLKDIKVTQELIWQKLGKHIDGFPRSPFTLTPARRRAVVQVWCELPSYMNSTADVCSKDAFSGASQCNLLDFRNTAHQLSYFFLLFCFDRKVRTLNFSSVLSLGSVPVTSRYQRFATFNYNKNNSNHPSSLVPFV